MKSLIIGLLAGILCTFSFIPQVIKTFKNQTTKDLSLITFSVLSLGVFLWLIYGLMIKAFPIIAANALTLILSLSIVIMKIKHG